MNSQNNITVLGLIAAFLLFTGCGPEEHNNNVIPNVFPDKDKTDTSGTSETVDTSSYVALDPFKVQCKKTVNTASWTTYDAYTVYCIRGFKPTKDPETDIYGGWKSLNIGNEDGFFRVKKYDGRWWLVDPLGNAFLSKGVAVFSPGSSTRQKQNVKDKFGSNQTWANSESRFLREDVGFNSFGAWGNTSEIKNLETKMPYTVILSPMGNYISYLKSRGLEKDAFNGAQSWEGYPYDFPMVFDEAFEQRVNSTISAAAGYKNDKYLIGYFIDNEIPWKESALQSCLQKWPSTHINHQKAQEWLDARKGRSGCSYSDANSADKKAFIAYCYEVYCQKVTAALKQYDPNHLFLGTRFNQWNAELVNEEMFKSAGKYVDVISINHYQKWQPDQDAMRNWSTWSGKPFMVTEFYTKGLDSGLGNTTGAGWVVNTQTDRGLFYENFVNELLRSKVCVGWHWFTYMDNDPTGNADSSNIDSNKGIVQWDCTRYNDLIVRMEEMNNSVFNLARFYDR